MIMFKVINFITIIAELFILFVDNGLEGSLFHIELYYDSELTETKDKQFKGKFVYKIATEKGSYSPHPLLNNCFISVNRNGTEEKMRILENTYV